MYCEGRDNITIVKAVDASRAMARSSSNIADIRSQWFMLLLSKSKSNIKPWRISLYIHRIWKLRMAVSLVYIYIYCNGVEVPQQG